MSSDDVFIGDWKATQVFPNFVLWELRSGQLQLAWRRLVMPGTVSELVSALSKDRDTSKAAAIAASSAPKTCFEIMMNASKRSTAAAAHYPPSCTSAQQSLQAANLLCTQMIVHRQAETALACPLKMGRCLSHLKGNAWISRITADK